MEPINHLNVLFGDAAPLGSRILHPGHQASPLEGYINPLTPISFFPTLRVFSSHDLRAIFRLDDVHDLRPVSPHPAPLTTVMSYTGPVRMDPPAGESPIWLFGYVPGLPLNIIGCITMLLIAAPHAWYLFTKRGVRSVGLLFALPL